MNKNISAEKKNAAKKMQVNSYLAVTKLFNRYFLKSFFGPFFMFAFPVLIFAILGSVMGFKIMLPGIIAMGSMSSGLTGMPFSIMELKKSVLLKRIGASPVKPYVFTIVIISYFTMMIFISILWLMLWALIITRDTSIFSPLGTIKGFFGFWYGNIVNIIVSLSLGFVIASVSKNEIAAQAIGMLIYFPSTFLSGQFISPEVIANKEALNWISRFIPFRYTTMIISESWYGDLKIDPNILAMMNQPGKPSIDLPEGNPFLIHDFKSFKMGNLTIDDIKSTEPVREYILSKKISFPVLWDKADHICGYVVPYVMIVTFSFISFKKFRWSAAR